MSLYKEQTLKIYNSLSGEKELFTPVHEEMLGCMFVAQQYIAMYIWVMFELL